MGRRLFPKPVHAKKGVGEAAFHTCARFYPSVLNLRMSRTRSQENHGLWAGPHYLKSQANGSDKTRLFGIMVIGWEEANDRIVGKAVNPEKTINDSRRRTPVRRLNN